MFVKHIHVEKIIFILSATSALKVKKSNTSMGFEYKVNFVPINVF